MEEWSDFRYFAQAEHFNTKNFFLRVLNTKNFTHYHDMFPSTAGKKTSLVHDHYPVNWSYHFRIAV